MKLQTLNQRFRANGKLLIAGEYTVLDGGLSFAIPTKLGQTLAVNCFEEKKHPSLFWEAFQNDGSLWFSAEFDLKSLEVISSENEELSQKLKNVFRAVGQLNPAFFQDQTQNILLTTKLEFDKNWGLGSSSTLIYLLAKWSSVDPFELNRLTFNTSGYDIACAGQSQPILYQISENKRRIEPVDFHPDFLDKLYFVYLNKKQDTQASVSGIYKSKTINEQLVREISELVLKMVKTNSLGEFEALIDRHEDLLSAHMEIPKVKDLYFSDYPGSIKSLGAWGGDFILVTARENFEAYFKSKGYNTVYRFNEMIIQN